MKEPIVFWGAGGHARMLASLIHSIDRFELVGVLDDLSPNPPADIESVPVETTFDQLQKWFDEGIRSAIPAVGDNSSRLRMGKQLIDLGFDVPSMQHPTAVIATNVQLGSGVVVAAGAIVNCDSHLGDFVLVNSGAVVEHGCHLKKGSALGPRVVVGGNSTIGEASWIGIGATVSHRVEVGDYTVVGAGAVVVHNLPDQIVAMGVPARVTRPRERDERVI